MSTAPIVENYEKLKPVVERLYEHTDHIAQMAILPLFLLSVLMAYSADLGIQGAVVSRLKRLIVTMLLLVAFPSITGLLKNLGQDIALSIDNLQGIEDFLRAASEKASQYSMSVKSVLDFGNDLIVSFFVSASFVILYLARYLLLAFYHFYWMILLVTGPFLILGNLFESTTNLTRNLFKSLMLVAAWPIIWSILSAFLKALPFENAYNMPGGYTAVVVMNLILALSLLFSPFLLSQFCEGTVVGAGSGVYAGAKAAVGFVAPKAAMMMTRAGERMAPVVRKNLPTRQSIARAASRFTQRSVVFCLLLSGVAWAESGTINLQPSLSSVLCFKTKPDYITLGEAKHFSAQRIGNNLLLRAKSTNQETNLLVFKKNVLVGSYQLTSNLIVPHDIQIGCESETVQRFKTKPKERIYSSARLGNLKAELLRKAWSNAGRDYFTIRIRLRNLGEKTWIPHWSKVVLQQAESSFAHSGLSSERQSVMPRASVTFDIQFTRPEISKNRGFVLIPSNLGDLKILVERGQK